MLSPKGRMRRFFPSSVDWRFVMEVVGAASAKAAEPRARRLWMRRIFFGLEKMDVVGLAGKVEYSRTFERGRSMYNKPRVEASDQTARVVYAR